MDYVFYLKETNERNLNKIYNNYGQKVFDNQEEFLRIFDQMGDNYGSMVFHRINNYYKLFRYNTVYKIKID